MALDVKIDLPEKKVVMQGCKGHLGVIKVQLQNLFSSSCPRNILLRVYNWPFM